MSENESINHEDMKLLLTIDSAEGEAENINIHAIEKFGSVKK